MKFDKLQLQHRDLGQDPKQSRAKPSTSSQIVNIELSDQELDSEETAHCDDSGEAERSVKTVSSCDPAGEPVKISHRDDIVNSTPINKMAPLFLMDTSRPSTSGATKNTHKNRSYFQVPEPKRQKNLTSIFSFDKLSPEQNASSYLLAYFHINNKTL